MNELERAVRETLRRHEPDVPLPDWEDALPTARRTRRRQLRNVAGGALVTIALAAGAMAAVGAILDVERSTPATQLRPPSDASVVVGQGETEGWQWLLSASEDGTCVALTDELGSETSCASETDAAALPGDEESTDLIDVAVRSAQSPAPSILFVFGRTSVRTEGVRIGLPTFEQVPGVVFDSPSGVTGDDRFFVGWVVDTPHPIVPDATVFALDLADEILDVAAVERPPWAVPPFTPVEILGSGTWASPIPGERAFRWELGIYRNEATDELCFGDGPAGDFCWDPEGPSIPGRPRLELVAFNTNTNDEGNGTGFAWGTFHEPVASVRVQIRSGRLIEQRTFPPPEGHPLEFSTFVFEFEFEGDDSGVVVALDADGNVVTRYAF